MAKIEPTVGRVMWFWPENSYALGHPPLAATIAAVNNNGTVNIGYLDPTGDHHKAVEVPIHEEGDERPVRRHVEWMPYQKGQAAKTEALETQVGDLRQGIVR